MRENGNNGLDPAPARTRALHPALAEVEPEAAAGFRFHAPRVLLLLILAVVTYLLFPVTAAPDLPSYEEGTVPTEDLIAAIDYEVLKPPLELRNEQGRAADAVDPIFVYDSTALGTVQGKVATLLDRINAAFEPGLSEDETNTRLQAASGESSLKIPPDAATYLRPPANRDMLRASLIAAIEEDLAGGAARASDLDGAITSPTNRIRYQSNGSDRTFPRDSITTLEQLQQNARRHLPAQAPAGLAELQGLIVSSHFEPSIRWDRTETFLARERARESVDPIKAGYKAEERVVTAREVIDGEDLERLRAYGDALAAAGLGFGGLGAWARIAGMILINGLVLLIFGLLVRLYRPQVYRSPMALLLLAVLYLTVTTVASLLAVAEQSPALIPIAFPALVAAMLWDGRLALTFALVIAILLTIQAPLGDTSARILLVLAGAAAAVSVRAVHRRAHGLMLGGVVGLAYLLGAVGAGLLFSWGFGEIARTTLLGTGNGLAAALIAVGLMPVFETWTGITTDQTLLELGDLNRPLLKRLSLEASGTYAHSINVANLAEAAARAIGANPLLARVGAYYHDIGKIADPEFFVENQARGVNPHDVMPARKSAAIVRRHVTEGLRLAEEANLPARLKAFITEHHGTQLIGFFYEKAKEAEGADLDAEGFRYPGPRPRSRETAILMLADSVESATKVLEEPTPAAISAVVDRIVAAKLDRGELDEAPLTLRDLTNIKEAFLSVLSGLFHHRLDYPAAVTEPLRNNGGEGTA